MLQATGVCVNRNRCRSDGTNWSNGQGGKDTLSLRLLARGALSGRGLRGACNIAGPWWSAFTQPLCLCTNRHGLPFSAAAFSAVRSSDVLATANAFALQPPQLCPSTNLKASTAAGDPFSQPRRLSLSTICSAAACSFDFCVSSELCIVESLGVCCGSAFR